jgi:hypothetical protein
MTSINNGNPELSWRNYQMKVSRGEMAPIPAHP